MKVLLISAFPPTSHNIGGPSALPYYLSVNKDKEIKQIDLIYFEGFEDKEHLFINAWKNHYTKIKKLKKRNQFVVYFYKLTEKLGLKSNIIGSNYYLTPTNKIVKKINSQNYDLIWLYPCTLLSWYQKLKKSNKIVMTGPDNSFLHYKLAHDIYINGTYKQYRAIKNLLKHLRISYLRENIWSNSKALIHTVGHEDTKMYKKMGATHNSFFSYHPHYIYTPIENAITTNKKLVILISGDNNSVYIGNYLDQIIETIVQNSFLNQFYKFRFLGKNFEKNNKRLRESGFETTIQNWVDSYETEIAKANIQLFPINLGTGTKGKVLSALATGLLCIGTKFAFENINIDKERDVLLLNKPQDILKHLSTIKHNPIYYAKVAKEATNKVRERHSPEITGQFFWQKVLNYFSE